MILSKRNRPLAFVAICLLAALLFSLYAIAQDGFLANVGFLVLGALVAVVTVLASDTLKRPGQIQDLAGSIHAELADRVARCCSDFEKPWQGFVDPQQYNPGVMSPLRLRKFSPTPPIIYPSSASQISILEGDAPQAVIQFYYRLSAWERDVINIARECEKNNTGVPIDAIRLLAVRLHQTLAPGLEGLRALEPMVDDWQRVEANAMRSYDIVLGREQTERSLRQRINALLLTQSAG